MITFQKRYVENTKLLNVCKFIADAIMVIVFAYVLILFSCDRTTIVGGSMQNSIANGDTVLINRMAYCVSGPKRNAIVAFEPSGLESSKIYVKRVIGLPGETIQIKNGKVYINGNVLENDISEDNILTPGIASNEIKLGSDEYFVLGDNRNNSEDSRFANIGIVKRSHIVGSVWMIMTPFSHMSLI